MIWLASFPRSGNTFFRIMLHEVYGLSSSEYHLEARYPRDPDYRNYPIVKTHLLPYQLEPVDPDIPAVYLIRDGRDALVSIARHRSDIIAPGSDYATNLREAIIAENRTFFGGWSENVNQWRRRATIMIRFEDLISEPIASIESLRRFMELPPPRTTEMPTIDQLRRRKLPFAPPYHETLSPEELAQWQRKFFRRGKVGSWKDEMPESLQDLFWKLHGHTMIALGYGEESRQASKHIQSSHRHRVSRHDCEIDKTIDVINSRVRDREPAVSRKKILIEGSEIMMAARDGCQRYVLELLRALAPIAKARSNEWNINVHVGRGKIYDLLDIAGYLMPEPRCDEDEGQARKLGMEFRILSAKLRFDSFLYNWSRTNLPEFLFNLIMAKRQVLGAIWHCVTYLGRKQSQSDTNSFDLVHLTIPQFYTALPGCITRLVTTIHDLSHLSHPQFHVRNNIDAAEKGMRFSITQNAGYIAVSEATRKDVFKHFPEVDLSLTFAVHEATNPHVFYPVTDNKERLRVRRKYRITENTPYILSLCTLEPRKNLDSVIRAYAQLIEVCPETDVILVISGQRGWKFDDIISEAADLRDRLIFTGFIDDGDLASIYSDALVFTYVSHFEGFGLPPLEAMSCGTPVIFGDNSSMPEVVGCGGLPADSNSVESITNQFRRIIEQPALREKLAERALHESKRFSWEKTALETLNVYTKMIETVDSNAFQIEV